MPRFFPSAIAGFLLLCPTLAVPAEAGDSDGLWINPALGIATPEEAAALMLKPFDDSFPPIGPRPERQYPNDDWSFHDTTNGALRPVSNCAEMLQAYRDGLTPVVWRPGVWALQECLTLSHLTALRPLAGRPAGHPDFLARRETILRLSPVIFSGGNLRNTCDAIRAELAGRPDRYDYASHGDADFRRLPLIEAKPSRDRPDDVWALWPLGEKIEIRGIEAITSMILDLSYFSYLFELWGVGALAETGAPVLVLLVVENYKDGALGHVPKPAVLSYDPALDMFRFLNLRDFEPEFAERPYAGDCYLPAPAE